MMGALTQKMIFKEYQRLHRKKQWMRGYSTQAHVERIGELIEKTGSHRLLDYGCGKGKQYTVRAFHSKWGIKTPYCYDPGIPDYKLKPDPGRLFDGTICVDVLEHVMEEHVKETLQEIFDYSEKFVFLVIATKAAKKEFLGGINLHLTQRPPSWWKRKIASCRKRPGLIVDVVFGTRIRKPKEPKVQESNYDNNN